MEEVSRERFYNTVSQWEDVPFSQWEGWVRMQSGDIEKRVKFFLDANIGCAAHVKKLGSLKMLYIDSECLRYKNTKPATWTHFYTDISKLGYHIVEVNSRRPYQSQCEVGMRQAGYLRPVGSFSYELTNLVDLTQPLRYDENWRRNMKKAATSSLILTEVQKVTVQDLHDFTRLYREMAAQKKLMFPFTDDMLRWLLQDPHFRLFFLSTNTNERISAIVIHQHKQTAGLLYAANGKTAAQYYAGFEMYRQLLEQLQSEEVQWFDMEKMGPSIHSTNAVFHFKNGIKGTLTPLCGEWSWYKYRWLAVGMYFVKKYLWHKQQA